jgi:hypothetical protein
MGAHRSRHSLTVRTTTRRASSYPRPIDAGALENRGVETDARRDMVTARHDWMAAARGARVRSGMDWVGLVGLAVVVGSVIAAQRVNVAGVERTQPAADDREIGRAVGAGCQDALARTRSSAG